MEHYDGPAFFRNGRRERQVPQVSYHKPDKQVEQKKEKKKTNSQYNTVRAFSPKYVPQSLVHTTPVVERTDYAKLINALKKDPGDYLLFDSGILFGSEAIDLTKERPKVNEVKNVSEHTAARSKEEHSKPLSDERALDEGPATTKSSSLPTKRPEISQETRPTEKVWRSVVTKEATTTGEVKRPVENTTLAQTEVRRPKKRLSGLAAALEHETKEVAQAEKLANTSVSNPDVQYTYPPLTLLPAPVVEADPALEQWVEEQVVTLNETLKAFNVEATVSEWTIGPTVTQFELTLGHGVKVNKITNLTDDLKLALAAKDIRIEAPIPGKSTVGIEIPNKTSRPVMLSEVLRSEKFQVASSPLTIALGVDLFGEPQITDIKKMPHGLIAGATGSGKSVFINSLLVSLLYKATPAEVKLLLIDPKAVEMAPYHDLPHLLAPVISDPQAAAAALKWLVNEMEERYQRLAAAGSRNIEVYNEKAKQAGEYSLQLPYIVVIIDELADLMMVASSEVQDHIARITQKARAAGIHLIVATQRPSVDIITGTIKNNIPTRIAFMVASQVDSRTILDTAGAERLLGRGDMLYLGNGASQPLRLQGTYIEDEVERITDFVRQSGRPKYAFDPDGLKQRVLESEKQDELLPRVLDYLVNEETISTSKLQRVFSIGYNRAASIIDTLESKQYISPAHGAKPRKVFLTQEGLDKLRATTTG
ncbi:DNA translocase FtsK [Ligilactobacillus faecis]|nr:DNA translocase FtsK [Ligilactobacillus faecis]WGN90600.1 DNA translocase FtsK [Ligilactobacillus faecis]